MNPILIDTRVFILPRAHSSAPPPPAALLHLHFVFRSRFCSRDQYAKTSRGVSPVPPWRRWSQRPSLRSLMTSSRPSRYSTSCAQILCPPSFTFFPYPFSLFETQRVHDNLCSPTAIFRTRAWQPLVLRLEERSKAYRWGILVKKWRLFGSGGYFFLQHKLGVMTTHHPWRHRQLRDFRSHVKSVGFAAFLRFLCLPALQLVGLSISAALRRTV